MSASNICKKISPRSSTNHLAGVTAQTGSAGNSDYPNCLVECPVALYRMIVILGEITPISEHAR